LISLYFSSHFVRSISIFFWAYEFNLHVPAISTRGKTPSAKPFLRGTEFESVIVSPVLKYTHAINGRIAAIASPLAK
jgi:hypothetical protein